MNTNGRNLINQTGMVPTADDIRWLQRKLKDQAEESRRLRGGRSVRELVQDANRPKHLRTRKR